jgi:uridine kinase
MKGDVLVLEEHHRQAAQSIVPEIVKEIKSKPTRYIIAVAGESGSGKSETGKAIVEELEKLRISAILLGQDDYFVLPPISNNIKRRENPEWLGPHVEVRLDILEANLKNAIQGKSEFSKPLIDYNENSVKEEIINLDGVKVVIVEGTYTSLLKNVDTRVFIARNRLDTLEHRQKRNRGDEMGDLFIEEILKTEHKIISGHKQLADFIITKEYDVIIVK